MEAAVHLDFLPRYFSLEAEVSIGYGIKERRRHMCLDNISQVPHSWCFESKGTLAELSFALMH